jgi:hypothetical protein
LHFNCSSVQLFPRTTAAILSREHCGPPRSNWLCPLSPSALQNWLAPQASDLRRVLFPPRSLCDSAFSFAFEFAGPLFSWSYKLLFPQLPCFQDYLRCYPGVTCPSLHSLLFAAPPADPPAPISQLPPLQWLTDSLSLLPFFCAGAPFIFNRLQTLFAKHRGWGVRHSRDSTQLASFFLLRRLFARCPCALYPQSRLHSRFS